jgi:cytochrome bd-type quinol oxidase subunit 1
MTIMIRLMDALAVVAAGSVTGGMLALVMIAWMLRRGGDPNAQGHRVLLYILACTTAALGLVVLVFTL